MKHRVLNNFTSTSFLIDHCEDYFAKDFVCLTKDFDYDEFHASSQGDVVFFGDVLEYVHRLQQLKYEKVRINTFSYRFADILHELLNVPKENINILSDHICSKSRMRELPSFHAPWEMVYAGRINHQKNISLLIWTNFYLQELYNMDVGLVILGEFDKTTHIDHVATEGRTDISYECIEKNVERLINSLPWKYEAPKIKHGLGPNEWTKELSVNSVLVNFSTSFQDDFGYSLKQAVEAGVPVIATDWGGLSDHQAYKLPVSTSYIFLNTLINTESFVQGIALSYAKKIANKDFIESPARSDYQKSVYVNRLQLIETINSALQEYGSDIELIGRHCTLLLCDEDAIGYKYREFFDKYRQILAGIDLSKKDLIAVPYSMFEHEWISMNDIVPVLMTSWLGTFDLERDFVIVQNDFFKRKTHLKYFINILRKCDHLLVLRLDPKEITFVRFMKNFVNSSVRLIFHLHENGPYAGWHYHRSHIDELFGERDLFFGSCIKDELAFKRGYPEANYECVPFVSQKTFTFRNLQSECKREQGDFVYMGRISELKNIHLLICAYAVYKKQASSPRKLRLFGKYDGLGIPLLAQIDPNYTEFLEELVQQYDLRDSVVFEGFIDQKEIFQRYIHPDDIFVSASVHLDENFGIAPYFFLAVEGRAILSRWGGYHDYIEFFPNSVSGCDVHRSQWGATVSITELANKMVQCEELKKIKNEDFDFRYNMRLVTERLENMFQKASGNTAKASEHLKTSLINCLDPIFYSKDKNFKNFREPFLQQLIELYGEQKAGNPGTVEKEIVPWVIIEEDQFLVSDPAREPFAIARVPSSELIEVKYKDNILKISKEDWSNLANLQLIFGFEAL